MEFGAEIYFWQAKELQIWRRMEILKGYYLTVFGHWK
jgi:hypothetical protein